MHYTIIAIYVFIYCIYISGALTRHFLLVSYIDLCLELVYNNCCLYAIRKIDLQRKYLETYSTLEIYMYCKDRFLDIYGFLRIKLNNRRATHKCKQLQNIYNFTL